MGKIKKDLEKIASAFTDPIFLLNGALALGAIGASIVSGVNSYHELTKVPASLDYGIISGLGSLVFAGLSVPLIVQEDSIIKYGI